MYSCIHFFQDPVSDLGWRYLLVEGQKWNFRLVKMFWSCHIQTLKFSREWRNCSALSHFCQNNERNFFKIVQFLQCNSTQQSFVITSDQLGMENVNKSQFLYLKSMSRDTRSGMVWGTNRDHSQQHNSNMLEPWLQSYILPRSHLQFFNSSASWLPLNSHLTKLEIKVYFAINWKISEESTPTFTILASTL